MFDELRQVQGLREFEPVVELHQAVRDGVVVEPHQVQVQNGGKHWKQGALFRIL